MNPNVPEVSWALAFLAGVVSFVSPCVLPLIPGYICLISGVSIQELKNETSVRIKKVLIPSILFILGFSAVFVALVVSASFLGGFLATHKTLLLKISGAIIVLLGLFFVGIIRIPQLYREKRFQITQSKYGWLGILLLGAAFGFGWTPCVGPILASILLYAGSVGGAGKGAALLFVYSSGLGIPFILCGLAFSRMLAAFNWVKQHYRIYNGAVGGILIAVGVLMVTNKLFYLNIWAQKFLSEVGLDLWKQF